MTMFSPLSGVAFEHTFLSCWPFGPCSKQCEHLATFPFFLAFVFPLFCLWFIGKTLPHLPPPQASQILSLDPQRGGPLYSSEGARGAFSRHYLGAYSPLLRILLGLKVYFIPFSGLGFFFFCLGWLLSLYAINRCVVVTATPIQRTLPKVFSFFDWL